MTHPALTLYDLLGKSLEKCLEGYKSPALQISGGLDSAVLHAIGKFNALYCVTFPDVDNITVAQVAALGKTVNAVTFTKDDMIKCLPAIAAATGGNCSWSQVAQYFVNSRIAKDGHDVVITGEGSDELFCGYSRYRPLMYIEKAFRDEKLSNYGPVLNHQFGDRRAVLIRCLDRTMPTKEATKIVDKYIKKHGELTYLPTDMARIEFENGLPALLDYGAAMAEIHGIACKFPYMDETVVKFAQELSADMKINDKENKHVLRELGRQIGVPAQITDETTKKGLFIPQSWNDDFDPKNPWDRGWFNKLVVRAME